MLYPSERELLDRHLVIGTIDPSPSNFRLLFTEKPEKKCVCIENLNMNRNELRMQARDPLIVSGQQNSKNTYCETFKLYNHNTCHLMSSSSCQHRTKRQIISLRIRVCDLHCDLWCSKFSINLLCTAIEQMIEEAQILETSVVILFVLVRFMVSSSNLHDFLTSTESIEFHFGNIIGFV